MDSLSSEPIVQNRVIMGKDSKGAVTLPDGTTVWLNAGSMLVYPDRFSDNKRSVKLEGEGYFEVVRDEKAPFFVETDGMVVNVLGPISMSRITRIRKRSKRPCFRVRWKSFCPV